MLRPEEMTRAVVVGSIESLDSTIECLYELGALHLIDFTKQDEEFRLGQPLPKASDASQKLLKLRAMMRSLEIEGHRPKERLRVDEITKQLEQAMVTLDLNTSSKAEARQKIQSMIREKESEIRALEPILSFGIRVEDYEGYDSLAVFVGTCKQDPEHAFIERIGDYELFKHERKADIVIAAFVAVEARLEASRILADHGFQELKLPKLQGDPAELVPRLQAEVQELQRDLARIESDIENLRKQFADFIVASEEHLAIEVLKAETPLRIATSANSFVINGWLPTSRLEEIKSTLEGRCRGLTFVQAVAREKEEEPPVKLKNPRPVKPFEFFIGLVSTPRYEEIDPTVAMFVTFPIFFGLMIGDLGFGLGLTALGVLIRLKLRNYPDLHKLGAIVIAGGLMASLFGAFVFAEAFGIPFHPPPSHPDEYSWEAVVSIPVHPMMEKMEDVLELLALSLVFGWIHLTVGFIFGFVNNVGHSRKYALAKVAWLVLLLGLFLELMTIAGNATETSKFMNATVLAPFPDNTLDLAGIRTSVAALALIVGGIVALPFTEGGQSVMEVIGLFTNLISYARIAALAVGKGAMAFAFNSMLLPLVFENGGGIGGILIGIGGIVTLAVVQLFFVFFLGALSAGIQAMRLNYVEFFLKFFEGGGTEFQPLRYERRYSVATR